MTAAASTTLPVGAVAPDFALPSTAGTDVTLSSFRGRKHVLLLTLASPELHVAYDVQLASRIEQ